MKKVSMSYHEAWQMVLDLEQIRTGESEMRKSLYRQTLDPMADELSIIEIEVQESHIEKMEKVLDKIKGVQK